MNLGKTALSVLGTVAPTILTAIGGPFGALAAGILHAALGTSGDDKAADAALAGASQDTLLKVKQAELDLQQKLAELGVQEEQLKYGDIANARAREIAVKDWTPSVLAYGITIGFFGTLAFMLIYGKPTTGGDALLVMLGALGTAWAGIISYYFGSSAGSASKDATLSNIAKGVVPK